MSDVLMMMLPCISYKGGRGEVVDEEVVAGATSSSRHDE
jgi:hypothetical protein